MCACVLANDGRTVVDDINFSREDFAPYVQSTITGLFALLQSVEDFDTMRTILSAVTSVLSGIEQMVQCWLHAYLPRFFVCGYG